MPQRNHTLASENATSCQDRTVLTSQSTSQVGMNSDYVEVGDTSTTSGPNALPLNNVWTSPLEEIEAQDEQQSDNAELVTSSTDSNIGRKGGNHPVCKKHKRIVYAGEILTHSILPHMTGHRSFQPQAYRQRLENNISSASPEMTIALPKIPYPSTLWASGRVYDETSQGPFNHLPPEDYLFLVQLKNILVYPCQRISDHLLTAFVRHFIPAFPIFDRGKLQSLFNEFARGNIKSPLLLHAILFAACQYADIGVLQEAGFDSRDAAKDYFHSRAVLLHAMNCEKEQFTLLQSLLCMSPWWTDYSEEKENRFWTTCAWNLAASMGLHKEVPASKMSFEERSLSRRIFWTIFVCQLLLLSQHLTIIYLLVPVKYRDHNIAIGVGRPPVIDLEDVDLDPLSEVDFYEAALPLESTIERISSVSCYAYSPIHGVFLVEVARFSIICKFI